MKISVFLNFCIVLTFVVSCVNGDYNRLTDTTNDTIAVADYNNNIKIPENFDPKIPLTDKIRDAVLHDLVVEKYYELENPNNRRKHYPVLYKRTVNGVIDLTLGGPLSYEEMWELEEQHGHTLREYFYDAAYKDKWSHWSNNIGQEPQFIYVDESSNLAKVYFIQDFAGFVHFNDEYCDDIINSIENDKKDEYVRQVREHQRLYE